MTLIEINKRYYSFPTSWNELTRQQLLAVIKLLNSNISLARAYLKLLFILSGISKWRFLLADTDELAQYFYLAEFFVRMNDLKKQLLPSYKSFYGPSDDFENIRGKEFAFTEAFFEKYTASNDAGALDTLIAVLYRRPKHFYNKKLNRKGDIRRAFNPHILEINKNNIAQWPRTIKLCIVAWYAGCRQHMMISNPKIFGSSGGGTPPQYGMWSIMRSVAEKGNHGDFQKVEDMLIKEIMMELNELIYEAERLEKISK